MLFSIALRILLTDFSPKPANLIHSLLWLCRVNKSIKLPGDVYELLEDYSFESPSAAACIVCGNSRNGWSEWKTSDGKTLKEVVKR